MTSLAVPDGGPVSGRVGIPPEFFREEDALTPLKRLLSRRLRDAALPGRHLRVWVPECGAGEDAYSAAMLVVEASGRRWREAQVSVLGTGTVRRDLEAARSGRFPASAEGLSPARRARFFTRERGWLLARAGLRVSCRFLQAPPDQAPPYAGFDLIDARSLLARLPASLRARQLRVFHAALRPDGVLLDRTAAAADEPALFSPVGSGRAYAAIHGPARAPAGPDSRLRESEERFRVLFARSEDAILVRDAATGRIVLANEAAARLFGWTSEELVGMDAADLRAAPDAVSRPHGERRSKERVALPHYRRKDGTCFPADATESSLVLDGRPCRLDVARDAAPRLRAASAGRRDERREAFVGEVIHELRAPISVIRGSAELLREGGAGAPESAEFVRFIESHSMRLAGLVDRLLDLSAADAGAVAGVSRARVPAARAIWESAGVFAPLARRKSIKLVLDVPPELELLADPAALATIFGNLLDNAIKFTPRGGTVSLSGAAEGDKAVFLVRDSGAGIPPEDCARVFERFFRSGRTSRVKGTGLGLAIVRGLAVSGGGSVEAGNHPAGGAVFRVALPLAPVRA